MSQKTIFGHPVGLYVLSGTELWERLSYYGMSAIFLLYLTHTDTIQALGWQNLSSDMAQNQALSVFGWYVMLIYMAPLLGGYCADRFLGQRKAMAWGGMMMAIGKLCLAIPFVFLGDMAKSFIYLGMGLNVLGTGLFKSSISTIVGDLYPQNDPRKDSGFTIFYMGINLGAFLAFLIVGYVAEYYSYQMAFLTTAIGMLVALIIQFAFGTWALGSIGYFIKKPNIDFSVQAMIPALTTVEWRNIVKICLFSLLAIIFWLGFEQSSSSLTLFAKEQTDLNLMGFQIPVTWLRLANPFFIFMFAPLLSIFWGSLKDKQPDSYGKYQWGFLFLALSFLVAAYGTPEGTAKASLVILLSVYFFMTIAELCISPVGLSVVSSYAPQAVRGFMMGLWFLATSIGGKLSAFISTFIVHDGYHFIFLLTAGLALLAWLSMMLGRRFFDRL